jgi:hypothetical protein
MKARSTRSLLQIKILSQCSNSVGILTRFSLIFNFTQQLPQCILHCAVTDLQSIEGKCVLTENTKQMKYITIALTHKHSTSSLILGTP